MLDSYISTRMQPGWRMMSGITSCRHFARNSSSLAVGTNQRRNTVIMVFSPSGRRLLDPRPLARPAHPAGEPAHRPASIKHTTCGKTYFKPPPTYGQESHAAPPPALKKHARADDPPDTAPLAPGTRAPAECPVCLTWCGILPHDPPPSGVRAGTCTRPRHDVGSSYQHRSPR